MRYFFVSFTFDNGQRQFASFNCASETYPSKRKLIEMAEAQSVAIGYPRFEVKRRMDIVNIQELSEADYNDFVSEKGKEK